MALVLPPKDAPERLRTQRDSKSCPPDS